MITASDAIYEAKNFWPFKCPNCLYEFAEEIGRINAGTKVICPECHTWLTDHDKQFIVKLTEARNGQFDPWRHMVRFKKL